MKISKNLKIEWKNITFNGLFALFTLLIVIIFHENVWLTTILLLILTIIGLIKWKSKLTWIILIFGGVFGAFSEILAIEFGVWKYSLVNFYNIPFWLFIVWANATAFIYQTAMEIKRLGVRK